MMRSRLRLSDKYLLLLLLVCFMQPATAQDVHDLAKYRAKYPGHHLIKLNEERKVKITLVKGLPKVVTSESTDFLVLDKMGSIGLLNGQVDFSVFEAISDINAYTLVPDGKSYKKIKASDFKTQSSTESTVFHDGTMVTTFLYNGLKEGSVRHLSYNSTAAKDYFPFGFSFFDRIPTEHSSFVIEMDTAVHLMVKPFYTDRIDLSYSEEIVKGKRIIRYATGNTLVLKPEVSALSPRYYAPHVLAQIAYYNTKSGRVNVIGSLKDLHDHYSATLAEVVNETPSDELKQIADSLTRDKQTELEKVKAIYYWVQDNVKYIAFEEGMGGFVPRQPSSVLTKRFGDCKDMASLIYAMLKSVNIPSYLTWVGSRDLPYKYSEFPSTFCDNHMITTYRSNGRNYFLDATNSFQSIEYPTAFIQGKEALLHISDTEYLLAEIPVLEAASSVFSDSSFVEIENNVLYGRSVITNTGYYNGLLGSMSGSVPAKEMNNFYSGIYERGNNSFVAANAAIVNRSDREAVMSASFDWKVMNYLTSYEDKLYVNMVLQKKFCAFDQFEDTRLSPLDLEQAFSDFYYVELDIPEGYALKVVPKDAGYKKGALDFGITYKQKPGKLIMELHYSCSSLVLSPADFKDYNEFVKIKNAALAESTVLVKIKK